MRTIEVYADIVCPFAYVGLTRLIERRRELGRDDVRFLIRSWPLELVNGKPVDAHFIEEEIDEIRPQVAPDLFSGFDSGRFPASTLPALALTIAAYDVSVSSGEDVAMTVRRSLFEDGLDVANAEVLAVIAKHHAITIPADHSRVRHEWAEGRNRGVVGSPHFFVDETSQFCPVLDIHRVDGALVVNVDEPAYEAFVALCFGDGS